MESEFSARIENMAMLYHSIVGERLAVNDLEAGNPVSYTHLRAHET
jgi:hypothetical protein